MDFRDVRVSTAYGVCTSGSTAPRWDATRQGPGFGATTSTTGANSCNEAAACTDLAATVVPWYFRT
jgi:hypothetical protein